MNNHESPERTLKSSIPSRTNYITTEVTENTETPEEYYIHNVILSSGQGFKVAYTEDGKTKQKL